VRKSHDPSNIEIYIASATWLLLTIAILVGTLWSFKYAWAYQQLYASTDTNNNYAYLNSSSDNVRLTYTCDETVGTTNTIKDIQLSLYKNTTNPPSVTLGINGTASTTLTATTSGTYTWYRFTGYNYPCTGGSFFLLLQANDANEVLWRGDSRDPQKGSISCNNCTYSATLKALNVILEGEETQQGGGGGGGEQGGENNIASTTLEEIDITTKLGFNAIILFFISAILTIWTWRSFTN
jgi:hypothetical protein